MQRFSFYLTCLYLLLLTACGAPAQPPAPPAPDVAGKLGGWTSGEASLSASFPKASVAQGRLEADGNFGFNFNTSVPTAALNDAPSCETLEPSDKDAQLNSFSALSVRIGGESKGVIALASSLEVVTEGLSTVGDFYVQYSYADRALTLKGSCPLNNPPATFSYDMTLKKGWNTVVFSLSEKREDGSQTLSMSTGPVPSEAAWFYRSQAQAEPEALYYSSLHLRPQTP